MAISKMAAGKVNEDFLKQLEKLKLVIDRKLNAQISGQKESVIAGQGLIFKDRFPYSPGDDIRHIDWKVYARTDRMFVKRFEAEKNLTAHVLIDYSGSMFYGEPMSKHIYASMIALGFAFLAHKDGEKFAINTFADSLEPVKPKRGPAQLASVYQYLTSKKPAGKTSYTKSLQKYAKTINSRSMVVVISDFLYDLKDIEDALWAFRKNELIIVQVLDKSEQSLEVEGDLNLTDLETSEVLRTFVTGAFKHEYKGILEHHIKGLEKLSTSMRAKFFTLTVGDPIFDFFYSLFGK